MAVDGESYALLGQVVAAGIAVGGPAVGAVGVRGRPQRHRAQLLLRLLSTLTREWREAR